METKTTDGTSPSTGAQTDYKAELEKAKAEIEAKNKEITQARFKIQQTIVEAKKSKVFSDDTEVKEPVAPDTESIIDEKLQQREDKRKSEEFLTKHSSNQDEVELAKFHLENTIKPSGNPEFDAQAALSIANRGTLVKKTEEMKTAMLNRNQMVSTAGGSGAGNSAPEGMNFSQHLTPEQLNNLRGVQKMNDKQIQMFIEKRQGQKHSIKP